MTEQPELAQLPAPQLTLPFTVFAALALFSDEECETLWDRVNRICDQYGLSQREHCAV